MQIPSEDDVERLKLALWEALQTAPLQLERYEPIQLYKLLWQVLPNLPPHQQLQFAEQIYEQIVDTFFLKAKYLLTDWEEKYRSRLPVAEVTASSEPPVLSLDDLDAWVRQTMSVNFEDFLAKPATKRQRTRKPKDEDSIAGEVSKEAALKLAAALEAEQNAEAMIKKLAGEEDPLAWADAISNWLQKYAPDQPVTFSELSRGVKLPFVAVWLGLLLGGYSLVQSSNLYESEIVILG
jgi:hypothetical protein